MSRQLDVPQKNEQGLPVCASLSSSTAVLNESVLPSSSKPTTLDIDQFLTCEWDASTHLSFATPFTKMITHGSTLICSFSTSQGMFSTKTRTNRVLAYLGASFCCKTVVFTTPSRFTRPKVATDLQVFIHDLASLEFWVEEMDDYPWVVPTECLVMSR